MKRTLCALAVAALFITFFAWPHGDTFSAEQINDMLQNKDESVQISKVELRNQGLHTPYLDLLLRSANWDMLGSVMVKQDSLFLTLDKQGQAGSIFARQPLEADSFEMELTFHIHTQAKLRLAADGMAIWFVAEPLPIGDVFGAKNYFDGLGIFVDTFRNGHKGHFPYIMAMQGDGRTRYDKYNDGMDTSLAGCTAKLVLNPKSGFSRMRIVYINGYILVDLNYNPRTEAWHNCFALSNVRLPPVKYLGISAETGEVTQSVEVSENRVFALYLPRGGFLQLVDELNFKGNDEKPRKLRKLVARMRKLEQRVREQARQRRLQKYGDPDFTFVRRCVARFKRAVKWTLVSVCVLLVTYVAWTAYRTAKQGNRRVRGLLD